MMKITPWSYRKDATLLHRLPGGIKLVFLLFLSLAAFFPGTEHLSLIILSCIAIILIVLSLMAHIRPWQLTRGSGPLLFMVLALFIYRGIGFFPLSFNPEGLRESIIFGIRIGTAFAAGSLLFGVTTVVEIKKSVSRLEIKLGIEKLRIGLGISLMLGFLKQFFEIWEDLNLAWKSRGGKNNLKRLLILIPLAVEKMMVRAAETAVIMESRGLFPL